MRRTGPPGPLTTVGGALAIAGLLRHRRATTAKGALLIAVDLLLPPVQRMNAQLSAERNRKAGAHY